MSKEKQAKPLVDESQVKKIKQSFKNPWKVAFLVLVGILLGGTIFIGSRLSQNREPSYEPSTTTVGEQSPTFQVSLKKQQVNEIISFYLNDFLKDSGVQYEFYLEDQALLSGTFKILGYEMKFYLYFDPFVMENGDVQLKAKSVSIGTLALPISEIMKYVSNSLDLPTWVEVNTEDKTLTLHLSQFKLKNGMYTRADKINLIDDDIRFNVYLPINQESEEKE